MKLLKEYLKRHAKLLILFPLVTLIFACVFYLYTLEVEAVWYAALLSLLVIVTITFYDLWRYYKKHKVLEQLKKGIVNGTEELPQASDLLEKDYQELLRILYANKIELISQADRKQTEMTEYLTMWAHQIKTPIAAMQLLLQAQRDTELTTELFKTEQYVDMIMQYFRMDYINQDLSLQYYDLSDIIKQVLRKYSKLFILKKISLNFKEPNCKVLTDEKWLTFVIEQILSNALKYTQEGSISIYMEQGADSVLVIEDTGIGIQEEDLPRIMEKGFTGFNGRMDKKSTGIGLYLCHSILKKLSHTIEITSKVGTGTKVKINLTKM